MDRDPVATLVTLHPLPTHGGYMDSHVYRKAAWRLPALADLAVLRFNTRGTSSPRGTSEGAFDGGEAERFDVAAAIEFAEFHDLPNRWLVGWSFGTELALKHGTDPAVEGAILLAPAAPRDGRGPRPLGRVRQAPRGPRARARRLPAARRGAPALRTRAERRGDRRRGRQAPVGGESSVRRVLDEIVGHVRPGFPLPLPTTWDGEAGATADRDTADSDQASYDASRSDGVVD